MAALRVGIVAGEKSGDLLAAELIKAIRLQHPDAQFYGLSGPLMQAEGATTIAAMDTISIFGLEGLFSSLREILSIRKQLYQLFLDKRPDVFIGVDVPDFNLGLERKLKMAGIPTVHYVSPTVWAWRTGRIKKIRRAVSLMLTLFPFEKTFYQEHGVEVAFVGHPLAERALSWESPKDFRAQLLGDGETLVAVLPGSRMSEVSRLGPVMFSALDRLAKERPELRFVIPAANQKLFACLQDMANRCAAPVELLEGQSRDLLSVCDFAILASGTAALEAALFAKPMIVLYKVSSLSRWVFGHTVKVKHFSMPNHLTSEPVVPELIQGEATAENLYSEVIKMLDDREYFAHMRTTLASIAPQLSVDSGQLAARAVLGLIARPHD